MDAIRVGTHAADAMTRGPLEARRAALERARGAGLDHVFAREIPFDGREEASGLGGDVELPPDRQHGEENRHEQVPVKAPGKARPDPGTKPREEGEDCEEG